MLGNAPQLMLKFGVPAIRLNALCRFQHASQPRFRNPPRFQYIKGMLSQIIIHILASQAQRESTRVGVDSRVSTTLEHSVRSPFPIGRVSS